MAKLMHAVQYNSYGGGSAALKHVEVPIPSPGENEVLIKVEASSINPLDIRIQKGVLWPFMRPKFPYIPVSDIAGEVVEVGPGVEKFKPGDRVVALVSPFEGGGLAEYAVTSQNLMASIPQQVSASQCAGLPVAAITAFQVLTQIIGIKLDGTGERKNILITAASGGVGHYAVQLAKLGNTHVTATCGARNMEFVKSLGADEVIDYKTPEGDALKSPSGKKYDAVVHCAINFPWSKFEPNLSINGKVVDITPGPKTMMITIMQKITFSTKKLVPFIFKIVKEEEFHFLVDLIKEGKLKTVIDSEYPLSKAEDGWEKMMQGHATGKIIFHHI